MKKVLLTSVAALAVFAAAAPAFAQEGDVTVGYNTDTTVPADSSIFPSLRQGFDVERESARLAENTPEGQIAVLEYTDLDGVVRRVEVKGTKKVAKEAGKDAAAPAKTAATPAAGTKALPKTSAVK